MDWLWNWFQPKAVRMRAFVLWPSARVELLDADGYLTRRRGVQITLRKSSVIGPYTFTALTVTGIATFPNLGSAGGSTVQLKLSASGLPDLVVDVTIVPDPANVPVSMRYVTAPPAGPVVDRTGTFSVQAELLNAAGTRAVVNKTGFLSFTAPAVPPATVPGTVIHQAGKGPTYDIMAGLSPVIVLALDDPAIP